MSLEKYTLPVSLIAELYKDALVSDVQLHQSSYPGHPGTGAIKKNIVIVLREGNTVYLDKILKACRLDRNDVALEKPGSLHYKELMKQYHCKIIILFGVAPAELQLPVDFPLFQLQPFNGVTYLYAPSLQETEQDKPKREKLWLSMKRLFNL